MAKFILVTSIFSAITLVLLAVCALIFQLFFYHSIPVQPNEAYGVADVMNLVFFIGIMLMACFTMLCGILLLAISSWRNIRIGIISLIISLVVPPTFYIMHSLA